MPGFGFRPSDGLRMIAPAVIEQGERALKVIDLSTTSVATELTFEIRDDRAQTACLAGSLEHDALLKDEITLRDERGNFYPRSKHGRESMSLGQHDFGFFGRSLAFERLPAHARRVVLAIRGKIGDWDVPVDLAPIAETGAVPVEDVSGEAITKDIIVRVVRAAFAPDRTFIEVEALSAKAAVSIRGIGDIQRNKDDLMVITGGEGRRFVEELSRETVRRPEGAQERAYAMFPPLPADARDLTLSVRSVMVEDKEPSLEIPLPLDERREMRFGRYAVAVGPTSIADDLPSVPGRPPGHGLRLAIGPVGGADEQALRPLAMGLDGAAASIHGWGWGWHSEPGFRNISAELASDITPRSLRLEGAMVKVRGPWEIRFARAR